jgi:hypothetical protein
MEMQKIQVRVDLERMVYNYALLGKIENDDATKIVSFIGLTIGGGDQPEVRGRIIAFPTPAGMKPPDTAKYPQPNNDEEEDDDWPSYEEWRIAFKGVGFEEHGRMGEKILLSLYDYRIESLEELAETNPEQVRRRHYIGDQSLEAMRTVLEKNGFVPCREWDIYKRCDKNA